MWIYHSPLNYMRTVKYLTDSLVNFTMLIYLHLYTKPRHFPFQLRVKSSMAKSSPVDNVQ